MGCLICVSLFCIAREVISIKLTYVFGLHCNSPCLQLIRVTHYGMIKMFSLSENNQFWGFKRPMFGTHIVTPHIYRKMHTPFSISFLEFTISKYTVSQNCCSSSTSEVIKNPCFTPQTWPPKCSRRARLGPADHGAFSGGRVSKR